MTDQSPKRGDTATNDVYDQLREQIATGGLEGGTRLTELGLAARYDVSRTPIREAMGRLVQDGLLERNGRELRVRSFSPEEVLEIYEVRIALERAAARAAATRRSKLDLIRMRSTVQDLEGLTDPSPVERSRLAHAFHFEMWQAGHNVALRDALQQLQTKVAGLVHSTLTTTSRWEEVVCETRKIYEAIESRDIERAGDLNERHMTKSRDIRLEIYGRASSAVVGSG